MIKIEAIIKRSLRWYFTKNALPYWCMLLMDSAIIVGAGLCIYWILNRTQSIFDNRIEVLYDLEGTKPTFHEKIRVAEVRAADFEKVSKDIDELVQISKQYDNMATVKKMKEIVPEYKSKNSEYEVLDVK